MHQQQLPLITEFEQATAEQLAWSKGRDIPTQEDLARAEKMVAKWNKIRIARKQKPLIWPVKNNFTRVVDWTRLSISKRDNNRLEIEND